MKKLSLLQTLLIAAAALAIGFLIGMFINLPMADKDELSGTIGKVDRYRNVKVTEEDLLLRNELIDDTAKRAQYEKYLLYYYYQSLRTTSDLEKVLAKTKTEADFSETQAKYAKGFENFTTYLEPARLDILNALNLIMSMNEDAEVPVIMYLNNAQNAIARIKSYDALMISYMDAIADFIQTHEDKTYVGLEDAHDILALNMLQSAILTQNKPVLTYLDSKKLMNEKEGVKELGSAEQLNSLLGSQLNLDAEKLGSFYGSNESLGSLFLLDSEKLQVIILDMEKLNGILCSENLGFGFTDSEVLGSRLLDEAQLQSVMILNAEQLGQSLLLSGEQLHLN